MPLPKKGTKDWEDEVKFYQNSTKDQRDARATELKYQDRHVYQNAMQYRGIHLSRAAVVPVKTNYELPPDSTWERHIQVIKDMDSLVAFHQKIPTEVTIEYKTDLPIALIQSSDWQLGQFGVDYDAFKTDITAIIKEPGVYLDLGGDAMQNIIQASKIGSSHNQTPIPVQHGLFMLTLKKLLKAGKMNTIRTGNHTHWSTALTGEDWLGERAKHLKVIYTKHGARVNLIVGDQEYPYMARHIGRFNSSFNETHSNKQEQRLNYPWARFTVFEHKHMAAMEQYRYDGRECVAIRPGTYAVYDDFAQQWGFYGAHVANPAVVLFPHEDRIVGFKDMYDAFVFLRQARKEATK
jgi:hypothetical protein